MMMNNVQQILPGFTVRSDAYFSNFYTPPSLQLAKTTLMAMVTQPGAAFVYLCGVEGVGKSHLLQAVCNLADELGKTSLYLPLSAVKDYGPDDILENTDAIDNLCLDGLDCLCGDAQWEEALFHLYNRRSAAGKNTVFAARATVPELPLQLPDLQTRLSACLVFQLPLLSDDEKAGLIQFRARLIGMAINDACTQFIIHRAGRKLSDLIKVLDRLDRESLIAGRKITVPFIKAVFQW